MVTNYIQLNHAGDEYDSTADTETYDTSGNLVSVGHIARQEMHLRHHGPALSRNRPVALKRPPAEVESGNDARRG